MVAEIEACQIDTNIQSTIHKPNKRYNWQRTSTEQWEQFSEQIEQCIKSNLILSQEITVDK